MRKETKMNKRVWTTIIIICISASIAMSICGCSTASKTQAVPDGSIPIEQAKETEGIYILSKDERSAVPVTFDFDREDSGYQTTVTATKSSWIKPAFADTYILWSEDRTDTDIAEYTVDYQNGEKLIYVSKDEKDTPVYHEVAQSAYWQGSNGTTNIHDVTSINGVEFSDYALFNEKKMKKVASALSPDAICYTFFSKDTPEETLANSEGKFILSCASPASVMLGISGEDEIEVPLDSRFAFSSSKIGEYDAHDNGKGYYEIALDTFSKPFMLFTDNENSSKACLIKIIK